MGSADDGAEVSIRSALGRHKEVAEGHNAKGFFFSNLGFILTFKLRYV